MALIGPHPHARGPADRDSQATEPTVLVLRALGLGDALTGVPALRGLRRRFGGRRLVLAADGPPAALLQTCGVVDAVVPTQGLDGEPPGLRLAAVVGIGHTRHVAVNLHGRGPASHRLLLAGHPSTLLCFANRHAWAAGGPRWDPAEHEVLRWCRLVEYAGGRCHPCDLRLSTPTARAPMAGVEGYVVVHPGAASGSRRWPAARWARVARWLADRGRRVVLTGGPDERALAAAVAADAGLAPSASLAGRLSLPELCVLVASAALVCCGDTGVAHLATAYGTPSVRLFGPTPPTAWGPLSDPGRHAVLWHGNGSGDPHGQWPDPALLRIGEAEVVTAAEALLAGQRWPG